MDLTELISIPVYGIESIGFLAAIAGSAVSSHRLLAHFRGKPEGVTCQRFQRRLRRSIVHGPEFLMAADIIRTVIAAELGPCNDIRADYPDRNLPRNDPAFRDRRAMAAEDSQTNRKRLRQPRFGLTGREYFKD